MTTITRQRSAGQMPFFGGASADDWLMDTNAVLLGKNAYPDSLLAAVVETSLRFGISIGHGYVPADKQTVTTSVDGHEPIGLDGQPAADRYAQLFRQDTNRRDWQSGSAQRGFAEWNGRA